MDKKVALVTGSSSGIGRATAVEFAQHGWDVVINYCNGKEAALDLKKELEEKYSIQALVCKADVSDEKQVQTMMADIGKKFGKIDAVVNNAGMVYDRSFEDIKVDEFKQTLNVDVMGAFIVSRMAEPYLRGGGLVSLMSPLQMAQKRFLLNA